MANLLSKPKMETCIQPVASINETLPEEILRLIFTEYFQPEEYFTFRGVCVYWCDLISGLFRGKTSLAMYESLSRMATRQITLAPIPPFEADLQLTSFTAFRRETAHFWASTLSTIERLLFAYASDYSPIDLAPFFERLASEGSPLREVTLYRLPIYHPLRGRILSSLNGLSALTRLHLCNMHEIRLPDTMPVFGQLEYLKLDYYNEDAGTFTHQLSGNLKELSLQSTQFAAEELPVEVKTSLERLKLKNVNGTRRFLAAFPLAHLSTHLVQSIANHLPALRALTLKDDRFGLSVFRDRPYLSTMRILSKLGALTQLKISLITLSDLQVEADLQTVPRFENLTTLTLQLSQTFENTHKTGLFARSLLLLFPHLCKLRFSVHSLDEEQAQILQRTLKQAGKSPGGMSPKLKQFTVKFKLNRGSAFRTVKHTYDLA